MEATVSNTPVSGDVDKAPAMAGTSALKGFLADARGVFDRYSKRTSAQHKRLVILIMLVGTVLRGFMLMAPITQEEAFAFVRFATLPVGDVVSNYVHAENHVLNTLLMKVSTGVFGTHLWSIRLPAFLAAVLSMPLFYLFVRAMFNRYIAIIALALVAGSGALIEHGALGRGYAIAWFCMTAAFALGRHMALTNNRMSGILIAVLCALGTWSVVSMVHATIMVYIWLFFYIASRYKGTLSRRLGTLFGSALICLVLGVLLYLPIISTHGIGQLIIHPDLDRGDWSVFAEQYPEFAYDLWEWLVGTSAEWFAYVGLLMVFFSTFTSGKYRMLTFALLLSTVPLVLLRGAVAPPADWLYSLYVLHLGMAIGVYYLLKFIQDRLINGFGKRSRSAIAALLLLLGTGWYGMAGIRERIPRFPEAAACGSYLAAALEPGDRIYVDHPWRDPVRFHVLAEGVPRACFSEGPAPGRYGFVVVGALPLQTVQGVLEGSGASIFEFDSWEMVKDWERMEIFAARSTVGNPGSDVPQAGFVPAAEDR